MVLLIFLISDKTSDKASTLHHQLEHYHHVSTYYMDLCHNTAFQLCTCVHIFCTLKSDGA